MLSMRIHPTMRRAARFGIVAAIAASALLMPTVSASAKTLDLVGTIDCGVRSGKRCEFGDKLILHTKDISGVEQAVELDVSWIKKEDLEGLEQDDYLRFEVEEKPGGGYQVLRIVSPDERTQQEEEDDSENDYDEEEPR